MLRAQYFPSGVIVATTYRKRSSGRDGPRRNFDVAVATTDTPSPNGRRFVPPEATAGGVVRPVIKPRTRGLVAMVAAAGVGTWGLHTYPVRTDDVFLALIELRNPPVFHALVYGYATVWFTTPFFHLSAACVHRAPERAGDRAGPTTASIRCPRSSAI